MEKREKGISRKSPPCMRMPLSPLPLVVTHVPLLWWLAKSALLAAALHFASHCDASKNAAVPPSSLYLQFDLLFTLPWEKKKPAL